MQKVGNLKLKSIWKSVLSLSKQNYAIVMLLVSFLMFGCYKEKPNNNETVNKSKVNVLLAPYCPDGPNSCINELITIEGYVDKYNTYSTKFMMWPTKDKEAKLNDAFDNSCIEVYYPKSDLSKYFTKVAKDYYSFDFVTKAVIHKAKIRVFQKDHPGIDDGNFLSVDSISQIDFYKVESNGSLTKL